MTKVDIFSGFLGAGKTTLIKKLIKEAYMGEKLVLIENEFGEIGIDGGFLKDAGINVTEMNSGCICCSLVGDFSTALKQVVDEFNPDRIIIEPSGVGKLSDVIRAVESADCNELVLNSFTTIVDANRCRMYMKNFGEFFNNQIENASTIILSHTSNITEKRIEESVRLIREHNSKATLITTDWDKLDGKQIVDAMEKVNSIEKELDSLKHEHEHHHHAHDEHCDCGCHEHEHHHHEHDEHCDCGCHEHEHHHHEHDEHCDCGCHEHEHHHHHHADEVFESFGVETTKKFTKAELGILLKAINDEAIYGMVVRAKGIVASDGADWIHFDYVPGEADIRSGSADVIGKICVIGSKLDKLKIRKLFNV